MPILTQKIKPIVLCILDGWGVREDEVGNAIAKANCINFKNLWLSYPHALLVNYGTSVGLSAKDVGNSEVGHLNLGAGRIVLQSVQKIDIAISDGTFFQNSAFKKAINHVLKNNSKIHLFGLIGPGVVHSSTNHLQALLTLLSKNNLSQKTKLHIFTDGRDSPPQSALGDVINLENYLVQNNFGQIASISGRYYAMDRDNRWDRTENAYIAIRGESSNRSQSASSALRYFYQNKITDEFINPTVIIDNSGKPVGAVEDNDAVIFFNFRPDRARQLTKAFVLENLTNLKASSGDKVITFKRGQKLKNLCFITMTQYERDLPITDIAFKPQEVEMPIARILSERNFHQLHIAETEKYAHVTYFFNGGRESPYQGEDRVLINSKKVPSYDQSPEMSAGEITKEVVKRIESRAYDFIVVNYANADMVAHTGNFQATVNAINALDFNIGILTKATLSVGGGLVITSDHGNAEEMINESTGLIDTEHNINLSPLLLITSEFKGKNLQLPTGILADIAPTILALLKVPKPPQMSGRNLLA